MPTNPKMQALQQNPFSLLFLSSGFFFFCAIKMLLQRGDKEAFKLLRCVPKNVPLLFRNVRPQRHRSVQHSMQRLNPFGIYSLNLSRKVQQLDQPILKLVHLVPRRKRASITMSARMWAHVHINDRIHHGGEGNGGG